MRQESRWCLKLGSREQPLKEVGRSRTEQRENLDFNIFAKEDSADNMRSWDRPSGLSHIEARGTDLCTSHH